MVTAGAPDVPPALVEQLGPEGRMVIPVGDAFSQNLVKIIKGPEEVTRKVLGGCRFVKLVGRQGWQAAS
jgi:protein-L-isoaspartate(D-aspartate) O-methyltransferase